MIVTLTGAKKNVGDFLIGDRAIKLLREFVDEDIVNLNRFVNVDADLDLINKSKALILCGGPAYREDIYPGIYSLVDDLAKIKVPIVPYGLGWSGSPFGEPEKFRFTESSKRLLDRVHSTISFSSCRDVVTKMVLESNGYKNVIMTGCPVWYDLNSIGLDFKINSNPRTIVFTTGAKKRLLPQTLGILKIIRAKFPDAKIYFSFHRGIKPGNGTSILKGVAYSTLAEIAKIYDVEVVDVSGEADRIDFYEGCDLHIGYRVHAHLYFISKRLPSFLINEDGRGQGMVRSLNQTELNYNDNRLKKKISAIIDAYKLGDNEEFYRTKEKLDTTFNQMKRFLKSIG